MINSSSEGQFVDITGDGCNSIQVALFNMSVDSGHRAQFISNYKTSTSKISKLGTNIRFFLNSRLKPISSDNFSPVIVLQGQKYDMTHYDQFMNDFYHIIWVTYRENFRSLSKAKLINSDVGWGCTIRVGQMLLLATLKRHLGVCDSKLVWDIQENLDTAPYSLHRIIEISSEFDKKPGDWHSPSSIAYVLTILLDNYPAENLKCYISMNCAVYRDEVHALALGISKEEAKNCCRCEVDDYIDLGVSCSACGKRLLSNKRWKNALFIQIPIMLGIGSLLPEYVNSLKVILDSDLTVGIIGGKPRMALFIVGYTRSHFIVLDPHLVQPAARSETEFKELLNTYHCKTPMIIPFEQIEGSFSIAFYLTNEEEWLHLERLLNDKRLKGIIGVFDTESECTIESTEIVEINSSYDYYFEE